MIRQFRRYASLLVLISTVSASHAATQDPPAEAPGQAVRSNESAQETQRQLRALLTQHPPSVGQVLRLDYSLLTNKEFLEPYPQLSGFLAEHPEVLRNPSYFAGSAENWGDVYYAPDRRSRDIAQFTAGLFVFITAFGGTAWIVKSVIDHRRWLRMSKVQTDVHSKLLDRFTGSEELLAYIQTPAGRRFLEAGPIFVDSASSLGNPIGRILLSLQIGLVVLSAGIGLLYASTRFQADIAQPFFVLGVLGIALGVGFAISALVSYSISRRLGVVHQRASVPTAPPA